MTTIANLDVEVEVEGGGKAAKELGSVEKAAQDLKQKGSEFLNGFKISGVAALGAVGVAVTAVAAATIGAATAIFSFVSETSEGFDRIDKLSKKIGLNAQEFQKLEFAAKKSGAPIEAIGDGLKTLTSMIDAQEKGGAALVTPFSQTLDLLRLSMDDLKAAAPQEQLEMIADALTGISDPLERTQAGIFLLGETGAKELQPLFDKGAKGIRALTDEAESYGLVSDDAIAKAGEFKSGMGSLDQQVQLLKASIFEELAPAVIDGVEAFSAWIKENDQLLKQDLPKLLADIGGALVDLAKFSWDVVESWQGMFKEIRDSKSELEHDFPGLIDGILNTLTFGLYSAWQETDKFGEEWDAMVAGIESALSGPFATLSEWWESFKDLMAETFEGPLNQFTNWFTEEFPEATASFGEFFESLEGPIARLGEILDGLMDKARGFIDQFSALRYHAEALGIVDEAERAETRGGVGFLGGGSGPEKQVDPAIEAGKLDAYNQGKGAAVAADSKRRERAEGSAILARVTAEKRAPSSSELRRMSQLGVDPKSIAAATPPPKPRTGAGGGGSKEPVTSNVGFGEALMAFRAGAGDAGAMAANLNLIGAKAPSAKGIAPTVAIDIVNMGPFTFQIKGGGDPKAIAEQVEVAISRTFKSARSKTAVDISSAIVL